MCPSCGALQPLAAPVGLAPGVTIERGYARIVVGDRLGEGGMGVVWRAWMYFPPTDPRASDPPEPIALKILRPEARARAEVRRFFQVEADALRRLSHPNIVRFLDLFDWPPGAGDAASTSVLAMELVEGEPLESVLARQVARARLAGPGSLPGLPFRRAWHYFQQLLGALASTHVLGIIHRDVKPANVLVRYDGVVKLTDFGIARIAGGTSTTDASLAPGTGAYMSPEAVLGKPLDGRSDLYSAGIVLYEMLAGRPPFPPEGRAEIAVRQDQLASRPPPLRTLVPQCPPVLDALFARALAKDPEQRFANAIEMGNAFRDALGLPDDEAWRAQQELVRETLKLAAAAKPSARVATLREFLVKRYQTERIV